MLSCVEPAGDSQDDKYRARSLCWGRFHAATIPITATGRIATASSSINSAGEEFEPTMNALKDATLKEAISGIRRFADEDGDGARCPSIPKSNPIEQAVVTRSTSGHEASIGRLGEAIDNHPPVKIQMATAIACFVENLAETFMANLLTGTTVDITVLSQDQVLSNGSAGTLELAGREMRQSVIEKRKFGREESCRGPVLMSNSCLEGIFELSNRNWNS